jgi:3-phenylpropionate/trans-cinnamate dioxygenase ferredoxin reductase component
VSHGVVIVGGGQAGFQTAFSLRAEGYEGPITLVGEEPHAPYQRPPLSKAFVLGKQNLTQILLRPESYYRDHAIRFLAGERAAVIETPEHRVLLASQVPVPYDTLAIASGARNRTLPIPGSTLEGVCYLRTLPEAIEIKQRIEAAQRIAVIGGGFIGLEIAASARTLGKEVTVIEMLPRLMARVVAPVVSEFFLRAHRSRDVRVLLNARIRQIRGTHGQAREAVLEDDSLHPADLFIVGIGIAPNTELAQLAGLAVNNGICVDEFLKTGDRRIHAIGDCAEYPNPFAGSRVRLESVQNAVDQAASVAKSMVGKEAPYRATPWFWSDQFEIRLQMVGLPTGFDSTAVRGQPEDGKFSVFYFRNGRLCAVDSINRPAEHIAARKLIGAGSALAPQQAADESVNLKAFLAETASP